MSKIIKKNKTRCGKRNKNKTRCGKRHLKKRGGAPGDGDLERLRKAHDDVAIQRMMEDPYLHVPLSSQIIEEDNEKLRKKGVLPQTLPAFLPRSAPMPPSTPIRVNDQGDIYNDGEEPDFSQVPYRTLEDIVLKGEVITFPEEGDNNRETKRRRKRGGGTYTQVKRNKKKFNGTKRHSKKRGGTPTQSEESKRLAEESKRLAEESKAKEHLQIASALFLKEEPLPAEKEAAAARRFREKLYESLNQKSKKASKEDIKVMIESLPPDDEELLEFAKTLTPDIP